MKWQRITIASINCIYSIIHLMMWYLRGQYYPKNIPKITIFPKKTIIAVLCADPVGLQCNKMKPSAAPSNLGAQASVNQ